MGASNGTFSKREKEKARQKKQQDKKEKREDRKSTTNKGQSLDQMLAYVDENGNLSLSPPNPRKSKPIDQQDITLGAAPREPEAPEEIIRQGTITMFNTAKGYGFIRDQQSQQSVFVHQKELIDAVGENDRVTFEIRHTPKGPSAVEVKKLVKNQA
ncbi:cold shock domain-containing protein [Spirosoma koreense]